MARRKPQGSMWPKVLVLIVICVVVGAVGGRLYGFYLSSGLVPALQQTGAGARPDAQPPTGPGADAVEDKTQDKKLAKMSRPELEREVQRLSRELNARNQQIDELNIQLKLQSVGSKTGK